MKKSLSLVLSVSLLLLTCKAAVGEAIPATIPSAVDAFVGDAEQFDDLTILCVQYQGA